MSSFDPLTLFSYLVALILAITLHEAGHAYAAKQFGDTTAEREGRLTLNPMNHLDPLGTVLFPLMQLMLQSPLLFGWAKPVPVDFYRLKPPRLGMLAVAFAGPFMNIIIAFISGLLLHINPGASTLMNDILMKSLQVNVVLAAFNLLPIPPLDGGRILVALLPKEMARSVARIEPYGFFIIMGMVFLPILTSGIIAPLRWFLSPLIHFILKGVLLLSFHGL